MLRPRQTSLQRARRVIAVRFYFKPAAARSRSLRWREAALLFRKGLEWHDANAGPWLHFGHALKEAGRLSEAIEAYRSAIERDPKRAELHFQLGVALEMIADSRAALSSFRRAQELDSRHAFVEEAIDRVKAAQKREPSQRRSASFEFAFEEPDLV